MCPLPCLLRLTVAKKVFLEHSKFVRYLTAKTLNRLNRKPSSSKAADQLNPFLRCGIGLGFQNNIQLGPWLKSKRPVETVSTIT
jgi:hypothetical protein